MGVGGQHHALAAFTPGKTRYPLYRRLGGPGSRSGWVQKMLPPPGFVSGPSSAQRVAIRTTLTRLTGIKSIMIKEIAIFTIILIWPPSSNCSAPCSTRPSLHFTTLIDTSFPFNFTLFHFTAFPFSFTPFKFSTTSFHITSPHFSSLHFCTIIIAFLTLFLKMSGLYGRVPNTSAGS